MMKWLRTPGAFLGALAIIGVTAGAGGYGLGVGL
jgi:hypothetical protein